LGHGSYQSEYSPKKLQLPINQRLRDKVIQVEAGFKCSVILMESKKIFWWGENGTMNK